jgi:hypothetical protein
MEMSPGELMDELITKYVGSALFGPFGAEVYRTGEGPKKRNIGLGWLLYAFVRTAQPEIVLEVGSGGSSIPVLFALRDNLNVPPFDKKGRLHTIDSFPWGDEVEFEGKIYRQPHLAFLKVLDKLELNDFCTFYHAKSQDIGKTWDKPIDILVVDGDHTYDAVKADWDNFSKWIKPGGYAFFHDTVACKDAIGCVLEKECTGSEFSFAIEPNGLSLSIIQRKFTVSPEAYFSCEWRKRLEGWESDPKASITDARGSGLILPWSGSYFQTQAEWDAGRNLFDWNKGAK